MEQLSLPRLSTKDLYKLSEDIKFGRMEGAHNECCHWRSPAEHALFKTNVHGGKKSEWPLFHQLHGGFQDLTMVLHVLR